MSISQFCQHQVRCEYDLEKKLLPPKIIFLDNLPEYLKPDTANTVARSKSTTKVTTNNGGLKKMLPVLQNDQGDLILYQNSEPFLLGDGGRSHFTNFKGQARRMMAPMPLPKPHQS